MYACIFVVPLLTLIFLVRSRFFTRGIIHGVSCGLALIMFSVSLGGMIEMIYSQGLESIQIMTWIKTGSFVANYLLRFDSLTLLMTSIFSLALVFIHLVQFLMRTMFGKLFHLKMTDLLVGLKEWVNFK